MALSDITKSELDEWGFLSTEVRGFDVYVKGNEWKGYEATISKLWDEEGSDAHVSTGGTFADTITELKAEIMEHIKELDITAGQLVKLAKKHDFSGDIDDLWALVNP